MILIEMKDWIWDLNFIYIKNILKIVELYENVVNYIILVGDVVYGNYCIVFVVEVGGEYGLLKFDVILNYDFKIGLFILELVFYNSCYFVYYMCLGKVEIVGFI